MDEDVLEEVGSGGNGGQSPEAMTIDSTEATIIDSTALQTGSMALQDGSMALDGSAAMAAKEEEAEEAEEADAHELDRYLEEYLFVPPPPMDRRGACGAQHEEGGGEAGNACSFGPAPVQQQPAWKERWPIGGIDPKEAVDPPIHSPIDSLLDGERLTEEGACASPAERKTIGSTVADSLAGQDDDQDEKDTPPCKFHASPAAAALSTVIEPYAHTKHLPFYASSVERLHATCSVTPIQAHSLPFASPEPAHATASTFFSPAAGANAATTTPSTAELPADQPPTPTLLGAHHGGISPSYGRYGSMARLLRQGTAWTSRLCDLAPAAGPLVTDVAPSIEAFLDGLTAETPIEEAAATAEAAAIAEAAATANVTTAQAEEKVGGFGVEQASEADRWESLSDSGASVTSTCTLSLTSLEDEQIANELVPALEDAVVHEAAIVIGGRRRQRGEALGSDYGSDLEEDSALGKGYALGKGFGEDEYTQLERLAELHAELAATAPELRMQVVPPKKRLKTATGYLAVASPMRRGPEATKYGLPAPSARPDVLGMTFGMTSGMNSGVTSGMASELEYHPGSYFPDRLDETDALDLWEAEELSPEETRMGCGK
jgi:hypothetical protein